MNCCTSSNMVNMIVGEVKKLEFLAVSSKQEDVIVITKATYELIDRGGNIVSSGNCEVVDTLISLLLSPINIGTYRLVITWEAPPQIDIEVMYVNVREV